jgi:hypothetical protein
VVGQGGLEAHIGPAHQAVRHQEGVGLRLAIEGGKGIKPPPELDDVATGRPPRQLPPEVGGIDVAREQEASLEHRLVTHCCEQLRQFHGINMPLAAFYCNQSAIYEVNLTSPWLRSTEPVLGEAGGIGAELRRHHLVG